MTKIKKINCFLLFATFACGNFFVSRNFVLADEPDYVVISEIQAGTSENGAKDEFVELYNPTDRTINLNGWELRKRSSSGSETNLVDSRKFLGSIAPKSFFLIAHRDYQGPIKPDLLYSTDSDLAYSNNSVVLYNKDHKNGSIVDIVSYSTIPKGKSIERKALQNGTCVSAQGNGELLGNGCDKTGTISDFEVRDTPNPQNSESQKEWYQNKPPFIELLSPKNGSTYFEGETINFSAKVFDPEDGEISNENIVWKDGDINLGYGREIAANNLNVGIHNIVLEAIDSSGGKTTKEIKIEVVSNEKEHTFAQEGSEGRSNGNTAIDEENTTNKVDGEQTEFCVEKGVVITEFLPNPEDSDRDNEFIEIYNRCKAEINLEGWQLEDKIGKTRKFKIPKGVRIKPGEYKAFYSSETGIVLNNSGDGVVLKNDKGKIISETPVCNLAPEGVSYALEEDEKWTWSLKPTPGKKNVFNLQSENAPWKKEERDAENKKAKDDSERESNKANNKISEQIQSKNAENSDNQIGKNLYDFSDRIVISEVYPNPKGRDNRDNNCEWIELYNDSNRDVNLKGWQIDDILGKGSKPYVIESDRIIRAKQYIVFSGCDTGLILNNSGDEVNLLWPDGTVVDSVEYSKAAQGLSFSLSDEDLWIWSSKATPAGKNKIESASINADADTSSKRKGSSSSASEQSFPSKINSEDENIERREDNESSYAEITRVSVEEAKKLPRYTLVKTSGIVSTPPGIFSPNTFYLWGSGIQVHSYKAKIPSLNIGDKVEIVGRISEVGGEKRILLNKTEDVKVVSHNNLVKPKIVSTGNVGKPIEGYLVTIRGRITKVDGNVFFLNDGSGNVKVYIKPQTGIVRPKMKIGSYAVITGQVSRTSAGYRVLPRFQQDVEVKKDTDSLIPKADRREWDKFFLFLLFSVAGTLILIDWGKMKLSQKQL